MPHPPSHTRKHTHKHTNTHMNTQFVQRSKARLEVMFRLANAKMREFLEG